MKEGNGVVGKVEEGVKAIGENIDNNKKKRLTNDKLEQAQRVSQ
jgi:hypothetical protein